jgi:uncharacterized membrane protein YphA (DoxX/SURF4 family)
VQRLGHLVMQTPHFLRSLNWYLDTLGLIVSDFQYVPGQRDRGPALAFIRCDRGTVPSDHHTLALSLGPATGYMHSAYQVTDLDAVAAGGEYQSLQMRDQLRVGPQRWRLVGVLEVAGALGLAAGFVVPMLGIAAVVGLALLMVGGIVAHARAQDLRNAGPAALLLVLAVVTVVLPVASI